MSDATPRVGLLQGLQQTFTLAWRSLLQIRHNPWELGDFSIQPILFLLLFLYVFGGAIADSTAEYLQFILPGVIVMNMVFVTVYVGHGLNTDLTKGIFDRFRALPIARWAPLTGRIVADLVKQTWAILLLLAVGFLLGFRLGTTPLGLVGMIVLVLIMALAVSWIMVLVGVVAKDPEHVQLFGFTALFPITFVSNVFVPVETMPDWLQVAVNHNPVSHLADAARGLLVGGPVVEPALWSLLWAVAITAIFAPLSVAALSRRLANS
ncbi:ABC transporter [Alkalilimnicola ehrlichii]|uniref:Transport permease protein n=1 Tax=Alkalilimnicola ehrlichii TaxID=351052 RepID=A0A3E0WNZ1_9GAMM|nr:ABC transporter permease [Alkalilimnicola ehrlichii]RFA26998.1 ABC transporter [Alkalilimnicola ehrlichii]RFA34119.1 ABC transporter [Alkalilimnicola ehrlichii]